YQRQPVDLLAEPERQAVVRGQARDATYRSADGVGGVVANRLLQGVEQVVAVVEADPRELLARRAEASYPSSPVGRPQCVGLAVLVPALVAVEVVLSHRDRRRARC